MPAAPTLRFDIYMGGDIMQAKQICREYCFAVGQCVHIEPVEFIFTGGEESGFKIGFINYARFPSSEEKLGKQASALADMVMQRLCQHSYSIVGPSETFFFSRRSDAAK